MTAFSSYEHASLADTVNIPNILSGSYLLTMSNGCKLTFGSIISLAGDYYGVPAKPICEGYPNSSELESRFNAAFNTLDQAPAADVYKLVKMIAKEGRIVSGAMNKGQSEFDALDNEAFKETLDAIDFTRENYIPLAENNLDHFNTTAEIAYQAGHRIAMQMASQAAAINDPIAQKKQLDRAFAFEAFTCHFLTDRFASGHIRTPRAALNQKFGAEIGSLLSLFQHDEDGIQYFNKVPTGLQVKNNRGETWEAFGDGQLFEKYSEDNKAMVERAVKMSINEVYQAFNEKRVLDPNECQVMDLLPHAIEKNFSPLFRLNAKNELEYRADIGNVNSTIFKKLSDDNVLELLAFYALRYAETTTVGKKISEAIDNLKQDANKIASCFSKLFNFSIFNHKTIKPNPEVKAESKMKHYI